MAYLCQPVGEAAARQADTLGVTRAPLGGQEGDEEELQGRDDADGDEGDGPPRQARSHQDDRAHDGVDDLPEGTEGAQRQERAAAAFDEAVQEARVASFLLDQVFDAGQGQTLNGLFDALGERGEGQGDER